MKRALVCVALWFPAGTMAQSTDPVWVSGSTQKVCQPNGEIDYETKQSTVSQTETNYGLVGDDVGSSFEHDGKLWLLFGDTQPTATFKGKPNSQTDPPRTPADNDAVGFTTGANIEHAVEHSNCPIFRQWRNSEQIITAPSREGVAGKEKDELACAIAYRTKAKPTEAFKNHRRLVATRMRNRSGCSLRRSLEDLCDRRRERAATKGEEK